MSLARSSGEILPGLDVLAFFPTDLAFADDFGQRAFHGQFDGAAVVLAHPAGEFEDLVAEERFFSDDLPYFFQMRILRVVGEADDVALRGGFAERDGDARANLHRARETRRDAVVEFAVEREVDHYLGDGCGHGRTILHPPSLKLRWTDRDRPREWIRLVLD